MTQEEGSQSRFRRHQGLIGLVEKILLICIPLAGVIGILDVFLYFGISVYVQQYLALLLGLVLAVTPLIVPATRKAPRKKLPWYDIILFFDRALYRHFLPLHSSIYEPAEMGQDNTGGNCHFTRP